MTDVTQPVEGDASVSDLSEISKGDLMLDFSVFFNVPQMKIMYIIFLCAKPNQLVITETYLRTTRELAKHENPTTPPWLEALFAEA